MKKAILLFAISSLISILGVAQTIENLDYISPFNEGLSAIKKGNQWGFINTEGIIAVDFRSDLVTTESDNGNYPIFKDSRCLIEKEKDGVFYYGYIDTSGSTVIEPQFLNALNFKKNMALALELGKEEVGKNEVLDKTVINYRYYEVIIDRNGKVKTYLDPKGVLIALDKKFLEKRPEIKTKRLSDNLVAQKNSNGKWAIKTVN